MVKNSLIYTTAESTPYRKNRALLSKLLIGKIFIIMISVLIFISCWGVSELQFVEVETGLEWKKVEHFDTEYVNLIAWGGPAGEEKFIGVGVSSSDGINWKYNPDSILRDYYVMDIAWSNDKFVAVTYTSDILYSYDGETWNVVTNTPCNQYSRVAGGNGAFVAVAIKNFYDTLVYSSDGITWTEVSDSKLSNEYVNNIIWANDRFVVLSNNGKILSSTDGGKTWTVNHSSPTTYEHIAWGNGTFVAIDMNNMIYSTNGTTWTGETTSNLFGEYDYFNRICWGGGRFVAGSMKGKIAHSADGKNWVLAANSTFTSSIDKIVWGNNRFIASNRRGWAAYSVDGSSWTPLTAFCSHLIGSIAWGNNKFVAMGINRYQRPILAYSYDGIKWEPVLNSNLGSSPSYPYRGRNYITWGGSPGDEKFVAASADKIAYSKDGITWYGGLDSIFESDDFVLCVAWGGGKFIAGSNYGYMAYSNNGITNWQLASGDGRIFEGPIYCIAWGNGKFVAGGTGGEIVYSLDGVNWIKAANTVFNYPIYGIAWGNGVFVAAGSKDGSAGKSRLAYSYDGINWTSAADLTIGEHYCVAWGNGKFVAGSYDSKIAYSSDGINWVELQDELFPSSSSVYSMCWGNGRFVAGGGFIHAYSTNTYQMK